VPRKFLVAFQQRTLALVEHPLPTTKFLAVFVHGETAFTART
jgi:hypothetical protein